MVRLTIFSSSSTVNSNGASIRTTRDFPPKTNLFFRFNFFSVSLSLFFSLAQTPRFGRRATNSSRLSVRKEIGVYYCRSPTRRRHTTRGCQYKPTECKKNKKTSKKKRKGKKEALPAPRLITTPGAGALFPFQISGRAEISGWTRASFIIRLAIVIVLNMKKRTWVVE